MKAEKLTRAEFRKAIRFQVSIGPYGCPWARGGFGQTTAQVGLAALEIPVVSGCSCIFIPQTGPSLADLAWAPGPRAVYKAQDPDFLRAVQSLGILE